MTRTTRLFVWSAIAAMALFAVGILAWRADAFANLGGLPAPERLKLTTAAFGLVFLPAWLALGVLFMTWTLAKPRLRLADDHRRVAESSLIAATIFMVGVQLWVATGVILGEPPGRDFGVRLIEALAGVFLIVTANFAAKTSPPQGWSDPGRWIRATLRTGWVGVTAGVVILAGAIMAPMRSVVWIVLGAMVVYVAAAVLNHLRARRTPA